MHSNRPRRLVWPPDVHLRAPVAPAGVAVGAAVVDVLVAPFPVVRLLLRVPVLVLLLLPLLLRVPALSPLVRLALVRVAAVRVGPSPRLRVVRLVDAPVAPPVGAVRLADVVEGAALRRFHSVVSAIGPAMRRIRRRSSS